MELDNRNQQDQTNPELKALIIYWSATGNTEKVANAIRRSLEREKVRPTLRKITEAVEEELYEYDLVFLGSPTHDFLPPKPVQRFVKEKMKHHRERGDVKPCAPRVPGKTGVVFCTFSGPHTGVREAIPVGKYIGQFLEHLGFEVAGEWYIVGELHGHGELLNNTRGKLGDIRGRPDEQDLATVENNVSELVRSMRVCSG